MVCFPHFEMSRTEAPVEHVLLLKLDGVILVDLFGMIAVRPISYSHETKIEIHELVFQTLMFVQTFVGIFVIVDMVVKHEHGACASIGRCFSMLEHVGPGPALGVFEQMLC